MSLLHGWNCLFLFYLWLLCFSLLFGWVLCVVPPTCLCVTTKVPGLFCKPCLVEAACLTARRALYNHRRRDEMQLSVNPPTSLNLDCIFSPSVPGAVGVDWHFFFTLIPPLVYWLDDVLFGFPAKLDFLSFYLELFLFVISLGPHCRIISATIQTFFDTLVNKCC